MSKNKEKKRKRRIARTFGPELSKWLESLPGEDFDRELQIAIRNTERIRAHRNPK